MKDSNGFICTLVDSKTGNVDDLFEELENLLGRSVISFLGTGGLREVLSIDGTKVLLCRDESGKILGLMILVYPSSHQVVKVVRLYHQSELCTASVVDVIEVMLNQISRLYNGKPLTVLLSTSEIETRDILMDEFSMRAKAVIRDKDRRTSVAFCYTYPFQRTLH